MHPNPQNLKFAKCVHHTYLYLVFYRHSKVNCLCATFKTFKTITPVMCSCFSSWESIKCFTIFFMFIWLHTFISMNNVLAPNIGKRARQRVPNPLNITNNQIKLRTLWTWEIKILVCAKENYMGAALEANTHEKMINHLMPFVGIDIHLSQNYIFFISVFI